MTGEPEYDQVDYIGAKEQSAYRNHGGAEAEAMQLAPFGGIAAIPTSIKAHMRANEIASTYGHNQAEQLSQNHRLWDKPSALGGTHYLSYEHKELKRFVNEKFDPSSVHEAGRYYNKVGNDLIDFSGRIRDAAMKTEQSWQGQAGDAMRTKMTSLSDHMGHSGQAAQLTGNQLGMQAEAAERARNSMPEPVEVDVQSELKRINGIEDPTQQTEEANKLKKKMADSQAAHQEAARVVGSMEGDFGSAAALTPKFAPPPPPPSEDSGGTVGMPGSGGGVGGFVSPGGGSGGGPAGTSSQSAGPTLSPSTYSTVDSASSRSGPMLNASNTWSSWASSDSGNSQGVQRGQDGTQWRRGPNGEWQRQNPYNGRWAPAPHGPNGPGAGRGGTAGGRAGGGTGGGRAGGGTGGGRAGGGVGGGRAGGGVGPRGSGNPLSAGGQSGGRVAGTPGSPTSSTSASSSSTSSSRGGRMPMGGMGGRGQGDDDGDEHERKYVMETDEAWDELGIQRVAPPVLGALPDEEGGDR